MVFLDKFCDALTPFIAAVAGLLGGVAAVMVAYVQVKQLPRMPNAAASPARVQGHARPARAGGRPRNTGVLTPARRRLARPRTGRFALVAKVLLTVVVWAAPVFSVIFLLLLLAGSGAGVAALAGLLGGVAGGVVGYVGNGFIRAREDRRVIGVIIVRAMPVFFVVFLLGLLAGGGVNMSIRKHFSLSVSDMYHPSGKMGDIGDVGILRVPGEDQFNYEPMGRGPHEWEWKYINGEPNDRPAQFAGVMYLHPPNNWGTDPNGGRDLRHAAHVIKWEARSDREEVYVEFVIGGINWGWDEQHKRVSARYPDSMPRTSVGTKRLTSTWQQFSVDLKERGLDKEEYFKKVIGGFGWVINWGPNGIVWDSKDERPSDIKKFEIEIRNIRYERR